MSELDDILELSGEAGEKGPAGEARPAGKPRWLLGALLTLLFTLLGALAIVLTWWACFALVQHHAVLYALACLMTFGAPAILWLILFLLTRRAAGPTRQRLRLTSAIGFAIAVVLSYVLLIPWVAFAIAFRDVRM